MLYIHLKSLLSFGFYRRLIFATRRQMVLYAFYLFFLSCVVAYFAAGSYVNRTIPLLLKNFPQVTFEKGVLTAPEQAVSAQIPNTDFKITFDASAQHPPSREDFVRTNTLFWVNKNTVYIPSADGVQTQPVPSLKIWH